MMKHCGGCGTKRDIAAHSIPEWEQLRESASEIKNNVLSNLSDYLTHLKKRLRKNGIIVHWAADGKSIMKLFYDILTATWRNTRW